MDLCARSHAGPVGLPTQIVQSYSRRCFSLRFCLVIPAGIVGESAWTATSRRATLVRLAKMSNIPLVAIGPLSLPNFRPFRAKRLTANARNGYVSLLSVARAAHSFDEIHRNGHEGDRQSIEGETNKPLRAFPRFDTSPPAILPHFALFHPHRLE
ncbi:hypothetical protein CIHG_07803 [Coccidioides immitis H538.4]|uniref:Uncharacterized protein n=3 Tax=Coccidioides immitis TaxID=5501 RepID=A0A0J8QX80_COCIT|nr:hypothetical protein CIRG_05627 [Coccidioides immitis RMSCC 2394]KMU76620.1 hypothetical protein CISG_05763 [Coccidioides immitis RMSCC 3703]KMU89770.1 hypothetical protein CIHG_07803 [Coccidioides immitis H538.4]